VTDGEFGLFSRVGETSYDTLTVESDDPSYAGDPAGLPAAGGSRVAVSRVETFINPEPILASLASSQRAGDDRFFTEGQVLDRGHDDFEATVAGGGDLLDFVHLRADLLARRLQAERPNDRLFAALGVAVDESDAEDEMFDVLAGNQWEQFRHT
jgi:hypothetical protein